MPRRPPRLLVAATAVLLAAVVGLWVRSYFACDAATWWRGADPRYDISFEGGGIESGRGKIRLWHYRGIAVLGVSAGVYYERWQSRDLIDPPVQHDRVNVRIAGAQLLVRPTPKAFHETRMLAVVIPYWLVCAPLALLVWMCWRRRTATPVAAACRTCGYDLTANASGRCPECGTAVAVVAAADR